MQGLCNFMSCISHGFNSSFLGSSQIQDTLIEYCKIQLLMDVPVFMGVDEQVYGEFKAGEIAVIPMPNVLALLSPKACEII